MKKTEFLEALETCLDGMDESERRASVEYYAEMIDERMEDGMDEESAVGALGSPFLAAEQLRAARADAQAAQTTGDGGKAGKDVGAQTTDAADAAQTVDTKAEETAGKNEKQMKKAPGAMRTLLLVLGFPLWFPLLLAAVLLLLSAYIILWSVLASLWCVFAAFALSGAACVAAVVIGFVTNGAAAGLFYTGAALTLAALSIFTFLGARVLTRLAARGTARSFSRFCSLFYTKSVR